MNQTKNFQKIITLNFALILILGLISCKQINKKTEAKEASPIKIENTDSTFRFKDGIIALFEDSKGNFWFGSKDDGVCKFDGKSYTYFSTKDGLPHKQVRIIQEDKKGNIFFHTGNGICYYNGKSFTPLSLPEIKNSTNTWQLTEDDLWFSVNSNGVLKYNGNELAYLEYPLAEKELTNGVHLPYLTLEIYKDNSGKMWFGTFNQGVVSYNGKSFEYHNPDNFGVGTIRSIFQDKSENFWFGSNGGGLYRYDGKVFTNFTKKHNLVNENPTYDKAGNLSRVWAIEQDEKGNMWFGTADSGLWFFDGETLTNYTSKDGLPSNFVAIIYKDSKGKLWFGDGMPSNGLLSHFNGKTFEKFDGFN